jgi:hypothetical protein
MKLSFSLLSVLVALPFAVACTTSADDGDGEVAEQEANAAKVAPGSFKLYGVPRFTPSPSCDVHTKLELTADGASKAHLEGAVDGVCEIAVSKNPRDYELSLARTSCGSRIYTGSFIRGIESWSITITDHRTRLCEDIVPAQIIVEETKDGMLGPITTQLYSSDAAPGEQELTVEGQLASVMGIGGESTGYAVQAQDGMYELVLDQGEKNQFVDGKKARVKGTLTFLSGVETQNRRAIDVKEMLVCPDPGYVNCMPRPNVRLSHLCAPANRDWVSASCDGVEYLD